MTSGTLISPSFNPNCLLYTSIVPYHVSSIEVKPLAPDKEIMFVVRPSSETQKTELNYGETNVYINVTSPDKTTSKTYQIIIQRAKIPWSVSTINLCDVYNNTCPICLAVFHCPKSIVDTTPKHLFCKSCIDELTRTTKQNPLNEQDLTGDWLINEPSLEEKLTILDVNCVFTRYGCMEKIKLGCLGQHMKQCEYRLCFVEKSKELIINKDLDDKMKVICDAIQWI